MMSQSTILVHHLKIQTPKSMMRSFSFSFSFSFSSSGNKYHNYYLRKRRKWPHPIYKQRWHQKLSQQHAMQNLKHQLLNNNNNNNNNPLSILINSFSLYNSDPSPNAYHFLIKTLIKTTSHSHHIHTLLTHIQKHENFETPESFFYDLIHFYAHKNDFQKALDLFYNVDKFRCVASVGLLNFLVSVLCKRKEGLVIVPQVLVKSRLMNIRLDESTFVVLIKGLCRFNKARSAVNLLCHMFDYGIEIDRSSFSLVFFTLCQLGYVDCDEVMGLVKEMRKIGFCFDRMDYVNVIRFLVRCGKGMDAFESLSEMKRHGFMPDVVCYTMVLDGVISVGEYECVERLFDEMLLCGLVPDINTYNVYVNGLCKQKKFHNGIMMLSCMEEIGCKPNTVTYNMILSAIYESGEIGLANDFLAQVRQKEVMLNSRTYEIMICRMVDTDYISKALDLLEEMVEKSLLPQSAIFDDVLCMLCQKGFVSKALNLLTEMLGKNVLPGCRSWEALLVKSQIKHDFKEIDFGDMEINPT